MAADNAPIRGETADAVLRLSQIQRALKHLGEMQSGLEEVVTAAIKRGEHVPAYELKSSPGRLNWTADVSKIVELGKMLNVDLHKPAVITPTQAVKAGVPEDLLVGFAERKNGAPKLVQTNLKKLKKVFSAQ
jgi:hypothetical protein